MSAARHRGLVLVLAVTAASWAAGAVLLTASRAADGVFCLCAGYVILASGLTSLRKGGR